ncbi:MAG: DUF1365 domain-containing protein [Actinomycetota bacterium]|nr:DUF1365 domain-containing protein [Actinomycetota bacterium]
MTTPAVPALVVGHVSHRRHVGVDDHFRYRSMQWLVDIDDIPQLRAAGRQFGLRSADHLSSNGFRPDLTALLAEWGIPLAADDRVLLLAHPRSAGYVFDPLSVFWCFTADGRLRAAILEVHNTYGERQAYVLPAESADELSGKWLVTKDFYVSPFNDAAGEYRVQLTLAADRLQVTVNLHRDGRLVLAATVGGPVVPLTAASMRTAVRRVRGVPYRIPLLIRWRAIRLLLRGLPVVSRRRNGGNLPTVVPRSSTGCPAAIGSRGVASGAGR